MLRDSPANRLLISANLIRLIYSIAEKSISLEGSENDRIVRVCSDYVRKHCEQSISVDELADLVSYSPSHFKSVFKKLTGIPPHEFVLREKIKIATELLRTKSITDVTFLLGFSSSQHFSRVFQSIVGVCPSEYRLQEQVKRRIKRAHNHKA
jgi:AraC family transcriptional regulator